MKLLSPLLGASGIALLSSCVIAVDRSDSPAPSPRSKKPAAVAAAPSPAGEFSRDVIDLGVVVSDIDASARFYTEAIGMTELDGFSVDAGFCTDAGLTDHHPLTIRVFSTSADENATRIKLMEVPDGGAAAGRNEFIHSQLGFRYLTLYVADTDAALERLEKAGVPTLAKSPVAIPDGRQLTLVADPDGNRVELIGP